MWQYLEFDENVVVQVYTVRSPQKNHGGRYSRDDVNLWDNPQQDPTRNKWSERRSDSQVETACEQQHLWNENVENVLDQYADNFILLRYCFLPFAADQLCFSGVPQIPAHVSL